MRLSMGLFLANGVNTKLMAWHGGVVRCHWPLSRARRHATLSLARWLLASGNVTRSPWLDLSLQLTKLESVASHKVPRAANSGHKPPNHHRLEPQQPPLGKRPPTTHGDLAGSSLIVSVRRRDDDTLSADCEAIKDSK